jgi:hypothetical protein
MIFINGEFISADFIIGPWVTDQEIMGIIENSKSDLSFKDLAELRTLCREHLTVSDRNRR